LNVKTEQKKTISYVLQRDTSGPVIFNAPAIASVNPVRDLSLSWTNPSGIILQSNPSAGHPGIISNGANKAFIKDLLEYNYPLSHALSQLSYERASKSCLQERRITSDD
jgi:hypothetical protein